MLNSFYYYSSYKNNNIKKNTFGKLKFFLFLPFSFIFYIIYIWTEQKYLSKAYYKPYGYGTIFMHVLWSDGMNNKKVSNKIKSLEAYFASNNVTSTISSHLISDNINI